MFYLIKQHLQFSNNGGSAMRNAMNDCLIQHRCITVPQLLLPVTTMLVDDYTP